MQEPLQLNKNEKLILENIISNGVVSQNEIASQMNINRAIVSKEIKNLETTELITITNDKNKKMISFNHEFANTIIIEIDRYFIHGFLNTSLGYNLERKSIKIDAIEVDVLFNNIDIVLDYLVEQRQKPIIGIGVAVHGIVDIDHIISYAPNTKWNNLNLKGVIEKKYDIYTTILNIANVSSLTEKVISEPSDKSLVSINIHSGIGAGFIFNNELFIGSNGHSLEIGHTKLSGYDTKCDCGAYGCLETEISYPKIINKMESLGYDNPSIDLFITLYKNGDKVIQSLYVDYIDLLSIAVRNLYLIIDPDTLKISCEIFQAIPKSIEVLKSKINSPIITTGNISISRLTSSTRCLGLSTQLTKGYLGISNINLYSYRQDIFCSYKDD